MATRGFKIMGVNTSTITTFTFFLLVSKFGNCIDFFPPRQYSNLLCVELLHTIPIKLISSWVGTLKHVKVEWGEFLCKPLYLKKKKRKKHIPESRFPSQKGALRFLIYKRGRGWRDGASKVLHSYCS